jgi:hypothetical protein
MSKYLPIRYELLPEYTANYYKYKEINLLNGSERIWKAWKHDENDTYYRKLNLYISDTYDATNKTIEEFKEIDNNIILKLIEPGKEPVFLCLYFNKLKKDGSLDNIDVVWSEIDKIICGKPLKRIQMSGPQVEYTFCPKWTRVIWFDFEDDSTFYIEISSKHKNERLNNIQCNYKILDELSPLMTRYQNTKKTYFSFWCCGKHFFL